MVSFSNVLSLCLFSVFILGANARNVRLLQRSEGGKEHGGEKNKEKQADIGTGEVRFVNITILFNVSANFIFNSTNEERQIFLDTYVRSYNNFEFLVDETDSNFCDTDPLNRTLIEGFILDFGDLAELFEGNQTGANLTLDGNVDLFSDVEIAKQGGIVGNDTSIGPGIDNDWIDLLTYFTGACTDCVSIKESYQQVQISCMFLTCSLRVL